MSAQALDRPVRAASTTVGEPRRESWPRTSRDLAELLVREGLVDRAQLDRALAEHRRSSERLVSILLQRKLVDEAELLDVLSARGGLQKVGLAGRTIAPEILGLVPAAVAWKYEVLPLERADQALTLAVADPTNVLALDDVAFMTGLEIRPVIARRSELQHEIRRRTAPVVPRGRGRR